MKILFITDLYPINNESVSKALVYFVQDWKNLGHDVEVIRPNFIFNSKIRGRNIIKEKIYFEDNIKIYNLNFHTPFWFNVRKKLPIDFSLKNYDIMISHMPSGALMAQRLLEKENIKYICSVHASDIIVLKNFKYSLYFRRKLLQSYLLADKISARSPVLQKKIEQIIPQIQDKTFVAYSGLDETFFVNDNYKGFNYEKLHFVTVSSLIKRKNIDVIIKTLSKIRYNFKFTIIGDGREYNHLIKLTKKYNLLDKIRFTGRLSRYEVSKNLRNKDIFVLLSDNETFGLVYLEAMEAGNIIIAKQNEGIDGILKDGHNAFLINGNCDDLLKCIEKIINLKEAELIKIRNNAIETAKNMNRIKAAENYLQNCIN